MTKQKILMIDDEPEFIRPHIEALQEEDYEVEVRRSIDDAIHLLRREHFNLIILDMLMPPTEKEQQEDTEELLDLRETGARLEKFIREELRIINTPIIFMSVVRTKEIREKIMEVERKYGNAFGFVSKPILPSDLIMEVKKYIKG